jgi:tol-pal system protein YbgF
MRIQPMTLTLACAVLVLGVGCNQQEQMKKVEQESGDLKIEVFRLRQQIEELNRRSESDRTALAEARSQDRRFQADLQETLRQLQDATRVLGTRLNEGSTARRAVPPGGSPATAGADEVTFTSLMSDYSRGNYALAVDNLENFLKSYPRSAKRPEALYYLGLSHYNLKAFDRAMDAFNRLAKDHPGTDFFLPARFKRAQCQQRMGLNAAAIASYKEIIENFPGTQEARNAQQELADLQAK